MILLISDPNNPQHLSFLPLPSMEREHELSHACLNSHKNGGFDESLGGEVEFVHGEGVGKLLVIPIAFF